MAVYPLLALLWALVLVPPLVRRRVNHRSELAEFDRIRLCFVGSTPAPSHDRADASLAQFRRSATHRRRRVLAVIGICMAVTLVAAVIVGTRVAWGMHLLIYDILIGYVGLLAHSRDRQARRQAVVPAPRLRSVPVTEPDRLPNPARLPRRPSPAPLPALLQAASR